MAKAIDGPTTGADDDRPLLVSMREAAALLSIGRSTLYELIERGEIIPVRIGRCVRFRPGDLRAFVDRRVDEARAAAGSVAGA